MSLAARREAVDRAIAAFHAGKDRPFRPGEAYAPPSAEDVTLRELVVTALSELEYTIKRIERAKPPSSAQRRPQQGPRLRRLRVIGQAAAKGDEEESE